MKSWTYKNFTIHEFFELQSTNSYAFELANLQKISDHEIILSHRQSAGRGRQNRVWSSPQGNLYFSLVLQPKISVEKITQISFVSIVALQIAVANIIKNKNKIQVKWPNDLLIEGKKVAGLLLESKISAQNCSFVILGIGLNIESNPDNTIFPATNLKNFGINILPRLVLENFLDEFEKIYYNWRNFGFRTTRQLWLKNVYRLKKEIDLSFDKKILNGVFEDLDEDGNLLLKQDNKIIRVFAADICHFSNTNLNWANLNLDLISGYEDRKKSL
jgi:BirA family biotin operon repressor/biotin-[acetyl-CoA-carboxylase] ligase